MASYDLERAVVRDAARLAGKLCMAVRAEIFQAPSYMEKSGREPVTIADYGAQAVVLQHIARHLPDDGSLAEERGSEFARLVADPQREQIVKHVAAMLVQDVTSADIESWLDFGRDKAASRLWLVDPIDGTKGFLRGDQFAVAVALLVNGEPVVGALACPMMPFGGDGATNARGVVAVAVRGEGAVVEPLEGGPVRPLAVSQQDDLSMARIVESVEIEHTDHNWSACILENAGVGGRPVRIDSQAKYFAVADGRAEMYIRNSPGGTYHENVWDHAAGALIVSEAGGKVTDLEGNALDFSQGAKLVNNTGILATNGLVHDALLEAISKNC